jgi:N6-adenosine-specific RNA methylase IME4
MRLPDIPQALGEYAMMPAPFERLSGGYGLIVADPPWAFKTRTRDGWGKSPQRHYDCMGLDAICALPVQTLAASDCWLMLWATNPMLPHGLKVMEAWGFGYVTKREWVKCGTSGKLAFGTGYILRGCNEPILIGKRGNPAICWKGMRSVLEAPRREHSRKPDGFYNDMDRFAGSVRKVDLFARERRLGWDAWGNELGRMERAA